MQKQKEGFSGERTVILPQIMVERSQKDPLLSSLYITDIGYYPNAYNHYRERKSPISEYVLLYCISGKGYIRHSGEEYPLNQNQYVVLPAAIPTGVIIKIPGQSTGYILMAVMHRIMSKEPKNHRM